MQAAADKLAQAFRQSILTPIADCDITLSTKLHQYSGFDYQRD